MYSKIESRACSLVQKRYASWLVSSSVPLAYVSAQLGHANLGVTAAHYARWVGDSYRDPPRLEAGEVPADLLARLGADRGCSRERA